MYFRLLPTLKFSYLCLPNLKVITCHYMLRLPQPIKVIFFVLSLLILLPEYQPSNLVICAYSISRSIHVTTCYDYLNQ